MSTESINILDILELGSIFWMNLGSLEYFLTNENQNIDENCLLSEIFETRYFHMTRWVYPTVTAAGINTEEGYIYQL